MLKPEVVLLSDTNRETLCLQYVRQPLPAVVASFGALGSSASYTSRSFGGVQSVRSQPTWARRAAGSATSAVTGSLGSRTGSVTTPEHPLATAPSASGTRVVISTLPVAPESPLMRARCTVVEQIIECDRATHNRQLG
jgi:hypothetical protein